MPNKHGWPVKTPPMLPGAILPGKRIVAYYGNPRSKKMGALGEYPKDEMLRRLKVEVAKWEKADPSLPVSPPCTWSRWWPKGSRVRPASTA